MKVYGYIIYFGYPKKYERRKRIVESEIGFKECCNECCCTESLIDEISRYSGQTVTIYTVSGGASGCGFTGILILCNSCFVRLITCIGPAPCCSLGSACVTPQCPTFNNGCRRGGIVNSVGAIVDIPFEKVAAFVHSAI